MKTSKSPYLENRWRLADVIAAIQVMGSYPWASRKVEDWESKLGKPLSSDDWGTLFGVHPEFFRLSDGWASLRWRHAYDRVFDVSQNKELTKDEIIKLTPDDEKNLTRKPLSSDQIEALLKTAIELHSSAIAHQAELRWWVPILFGLVGVIIGAILKG